MNIDYVYQLPHIVEPGETITAMGLSVNDGGKGLNQSIAMSRAGLEVYHAGMVKSGRETRSSRSMMRDRIALCCFRGQTVQIRRSTWMRY